WRAPIERLGSRLQELLPAARVEVCYMELSPPTLLDVTERLQLAGVTSATIVPAFLSPGGRHIKRDLPALVERVASQCTAVRLTLSPGALGDADGVIEAPARATLERV